ncbi:MULTISPECIES: F0F1 ATP synthase subunit delta [unclassified Caulobacter]|uniref:F0F1 ATP synthase subunit delta n=1 Tax=unclassified Caulobacter TaxID=2648921 RepID=UPI000D36FFF8|nr:MULTISPECIES: F0F1 ATP synthase subunit delta [unclassified Caulobacter]PTS84611.1 F0F1 ATP synthase subunit delta [Caulobacter sp. HMWF009]PTT09498.1 F0F1 ATP synthase subunit delta [Caulobacter sp. HMWF025]
MADETKATDAGQRYAQSLFELTIEGGQLTKVESDLKALKAMYADSTDLRRLIASPAFSAQDKAKGLAAIAAKAGFQPLTCKFLGLVATNGRAGDLMGAITAFAEMSAKHRGVVTAEVTSATDLTAAQLKGVQVALAQALGKTPELSTRVDPSILGGVKVRVGSRLFDASLRSKLDSLKFALKRA